VATLVLKQAYPVDFSMGDTANIFGAAAIHPPRAA
jgi:hypothetical protein